MINNIRKMLFRSYDLYKLQESRNIYDFNEARKKISKIIRITQRS